jgi:hypothetical protein
MADLTGIIILNKMPADASANITSYCFAIITEHYESFDKEEKKERDEFLSRFEKIVDTYYCLEGKEKEEFIDLCEEYLEISCDIDIGSSFWKAVRNSIDTETLHGQLFYWACDMRREAKYEAEYEEAEQAEQEDPKPEEEWCEEHEQVMWKNGMKCGGCLDEKD